YFKELKYGKYYFKEIEAPEGYVLSEEEHHFEIKENGETVKSELHNQIIESDVVITKKDIMTQKVIKGAKIEIYDINDKTVFSGFTDENGKVRVRLPYGEYTYKETIAPEGYVLAKKVGHISVKTHGATIEKTLWNSPIQLPQLPKTGTAGTLLYSIMGLGLLGSGIFISKRKNN
ncbi:MAG TPA: SpaA isopeptide-forming pilin-related protein, partial [Tissierellales bacterium]|nr:SpaA isopeptide-forming pilin-related protein [Tissierellales bacterium]